MKVRKILDTTAEWKMSGLYVRYRNTGYSVEYGSLQIEPSVFQVLRQAQEQARQRTALW